MIYKKCVEKELSNSTLFYYFALTNAKKPAIIEVTKVSDSKYSTSVK